MSDVKDFEIGYQLHNLGGWSDEQGKRDYLKPGFFKRLGWTSSDAEAINLTFRAARHNLPASLPRFRAAKGRHLGLLAVPAGLADIVQSDYPGAEVRRAIISTTRGGRTVAGLLPDGAMPGTVKLVNAWGDGELRLLAYPVPDRPPDADDDGPPEPVLETVLCRLPGKGTTQAAFGFIVDQSLALPHPSVVKSTAQGLAPTDDLMSWARVSNTPITNLY